MSVKFLVGRSYRQLNATSSLELDGTNGVLVERFETSQTSRGMCWHHERLRPWLICFLFWAIFVTKRSIFWQRKQDLSSWRLLVSRQLIYDAEYFLVSLRLASHEPEHGSLAHFLPKPSLSLYNSFAAFNFLHTSFLQTVCFGDWYMCSSKGCL